MSDKEIEQLQQKLKDFGTEVTKTKQSSQKFLREIGVITKDGSFNSNYKHLCTLPKQG